MRICSSVVVLQHRIRIREKRRQRSSLLLLLSIWPQDDLKKRTNRRTNTWRNGCFGKMNDHLVLNTPNHQPPQMDVLPKTFLWIILGYIATFKYVPPPAATTFAFPSVWFCLCCSYCISGNLLFVSFRPHTKRWDWWHIPISLLQGDKGIGMVLVIWASRTSLALIGWQNCLC